MKLQLSNKQQKSVGAVSPTASAMTLSTPGDDSYGDTQIRKWLDADGPNPWIHPSSVTADEPLPWTYPSGVTADEWFFISTLFFAPFSNLHSHIRECFKTIFVESGRRDVRNFVPEMAGLTALRFPWMATRLCKMATILKNNDMNMEAYVEQLRADQRGASANNPDPGLRRIVRDHGTSEWKTLYFFYRQCVIRRYHPIDIQREKSMANFGVPNLFWSHNESYESRFEQYERRLETVEKALLAPREPLPDESWNRPNCLCPGAFPKYTVGWPRKYESHPWTLLAWSDWNYPVSKECPHFGDHKNAVNNE